MGHFKGACGSKRMRVETTLGPGNRIAEQASDDPVEQLVARLPELVRPARFVEHRAQILPTDSRLPAQQHASHAHEPALDRQVRRIGALARIDGADRTTLANAPTVTIAGTQAGSAARTPARP